MSEAKDRLRDKAVQRPRMDSDPSSLRSFYEKGCSVKGRRGGPRYSVRLLASPVPPFYSHSDQRRRGARCMLGSGSCASSDAANSGTPSREQGAQRSHQGRDIGDAKSRHACSVIIQTCISILLLWNAVRKIGLRRPSLGLIGRIVGGAADPEPMQQHCELPGHGDHSALLGVLPAPRRNRPSIRSQITVGPKGAQDILGGAD